MSSTGFIREPACSILATELANIKNVSNVDMGDGKSKNIITTEIGTHLNRVFVVGLLSEVTETESGFVKGRILDKTGSFMVNAGQYQPEAAGFLKEHEDNVPIFVAVTGKVNVYEPEPGKMITSIRPEAMTISDEGTRNYWLRDAANTLDKKMTSPVFPEDLREKYETELKSIRLLLEEIQNDTHSETPHGAVPSAELAVESPSSVPVATSIPTPTTTDVSPPSTPAPLAQNTTYPTSSQPSGTDIPADSPSGLTQDEDIFLDAICSLSGESKSILSVAVVAKRAGMDWKKADQVVRELVRKNVVTQKAPGFIEPINTFNSPVSSMS